MQQLIKKNKLSPSSIVTYLNYSADIFRLASKYVWYSVLLYDREYRERQAEENFEWGVYRQDLRDFNLILRQHNPTSRALQDAGHANRGYNNRQVNERRKGPFLPDGREICRNFNNNACSRFDCKLVHTCAICFSASHSSINGHGAGQNNINRPLKN